MHAFKQPWFSHPEFTLFEAEAVQTNAYLRDFHELGPSLMRWFETDLEGYLFMKDSPNPNLRRRARSLAKSMPRYRALLRAMELLVPTEEMREKVREVRARIETEFGKSAALEKAMALGLFGVGRARELRTRHFGDAIQPHTRVFHYPEI